MTNTFTIAVIKIVSKFYILCTLKLSFYYPFYNVIMFTTDFLSETNYDYSNTLGIRTSLTKSIEHFIKV